jgi:hypothetical protein
MWIVNILSHIGGGVHDLQTGFGFDDWVYWHLIHTTWDYRQLQCYRYSHTLQVTVTHTLGFSVLVVISWQRIHNSLTVTSNHTWSLLCTAISSQLFCQLQTPETQLNSLSSCVRSLLYSLGANPQITPLPLLLGGYSLLQRCVYRTVV